MDVLTHLNWLNKVQEIIRIQSVYAQKKKKKKKLDNVAHIDRTVSN